MGRQMARAAIYARISRDDDDKREGVEDQTKRCLAHCESEGYEVVGAFSDNDISGKYGEDLRPDFARLVRLIQSGGVDVIIARDQSRIYRDVQLFLNFLNPICREAGVQQIELLNGKSVDPRRFDPMAVMQGVFDQEYREVISENTQQSKERKAKNGERLGGRRVYGYTKGSVPTIIEDEAALIREAARSVLEGKSLSSIVRQLNDEGVPTSTGSAWRQSTLSQMLKNRVYNGRTTLRGEDAGPGKWQSILDEKTFADVQALMEDPSRRPQHIGNEYPLVGVLRCGTCGKDLGSTPTRKNGERLRRYGCRSGHGNINADIVEKYVYGSVLPMADMPRVGEIIRDAEGQVDEAAAQLRVDIAKAKAKKAELAQAVSENVFSLDDIRKPSAQLQSEIAGYEAQLSALAGRSALDKFAGRVVKDWDSFDVEDKRAIVLSLLSCVKLSSSQGKSVTGIDRLRFDWKVEALADIVTEDGTVRGYTDTGITFTASAVSAEEAAALGLVGS